MSAMSRFALVALVAVSPALAKNTGYFTKEIECADRKGLESCYADADSFWSDCINDNCGGVSTGTNCANACTCVATGKYIDCAGAHCWNQVYSCEYQATVNDMLNTCVNADYDNIPFWPPPDDAKAGCSCNLGKIAYASHILTYEYENTCGAEETKKLGVSDDVKDIIPACRCCVETGYLTAMWDICPNTDPTLLGLDDIYDQLIKNDKNWDNCGEYLDAYPCDKTLGMTPPADNTTNFYAPDDFPKSGTQSLYNTGTVTSPVAGATYTYTYDGTTRSVAVKSADAKPTGSSGDNDSSDSGSDSNSDDSDDSNADSSKDDDEDAGRMLEPVLPLAGAFGLVTLLMMFA